MTEMNSNEVPVITEDMICSYRQKFYLIEAGYAVLGVVLSACGMLWWGIPSLIATVSFVLKARKDFSEPYVSMLPREYYKNDSHEIMAMSWFHVLIVVGGLYIPILAAATRRMLVCAVKMSKNASWLNDWTLRNAIMAEKIGVREKKALEFAQGFVSVLCDTGEWAELQMTENVIHLLKSSTLKSCIDKVSESIKANGCLKLADAVVVVQECFNGLGRNEAEKLLSDFSGSWRVLSLSSDKYLMDDAAIDVAVADLNRIVGEKERCSFADLEEVVKRRLGLSGNDALAFVEQSDGEFQNLPFEDGRFYVSDKMNGKIALCPSCGMARILSDKEQKEGGLHYCSDYCRETDEMIEKTVKQLRQRKLEQAGISAASFGAVLRRVAYSWDRNKGRVASLSGKAHGLAAEDANTIIDRLTGHDAKVVGDDNAKDGADRIVDGRLIQSKYCATATASVDDAFNKATGQYRYMDGNGKPMQLEVPKDQYVQAVEEMRRKILEGKVPGVTDPDEAKNLVRKGHLTYQQAQNVCKFGTIESLAFDAYTGAIVGMTAGGISFVLSTAIGYWHTKDMKKALKSAVVVGLRTGGRTFITYIITAQAQRIPAVKTFLDNTININFGGHGKAVKSLGDGLAKMSKGTNINKAANSAVKGAVVMAAATFAVTSAWEIGCYCCGRMSGMQCFKNIVVGGTSIAGGTGAGLVGAAWGTLICPGVGTVIGGLVGGLVGGMGGQAVAKSIMDQFIEDDANAVMRLVQEQIVAIATMFCMDQSEVDAAMKVVESYISDKRSFVGDVYSNIKKGNGRQYVTRLFKPMMVTVVMDRPLLLAKDVSADAVEAAVEEMS